MKSIETVTDTIIRLISAHRCPDGGWEIPVDEALRALDVDLRTFYRRLYEHRDVIDTIAPKTVDPGSMMILIAGICDNLTACETTFQERGLLLSIDHQIELVELIVEAASEAVAAHTIDEEMFEGIRRRYPDIREAIPIYIDTNFDLDAITDSSVRKFLASRPRMHKDIGEFQTRRLIALLYQRHILSGEILFKSIWHTLWPEESHDHSSARIDAVDPELSDALSVLGLGAVPDTGSDLKRVYRSLMKTYHPDVNPNGLVMSQKITDAYSRIVSSRFPAVKERV